MKRASSYVRFSTPEQARGDSFRRQTEKAEAWAHENGYQIVDTLADLGKSAFRGRNLKEDPLAEFLNGMRGGRVPKDIVLIIESLDRFSRDEAIDVLPIFIDILKAGLNVATVRWPPLHLRILPQRAHATARQPDGDDAGSRRVKTQKHARWGRMDSEA
jgi:DNA invertase Pin-like site-specific DNA recombinase